MEEPKKPEEPKARYEYGLYLRWWIFPAIHHGVVGDEFWRKLQRKEAKKRLRRMKFKQILRLN